MKTWHVYTHETKDSVLVGHGWRLRYIAIDLLTLIFPPVAFSLALVLWFDNYIKQAVSALAVQVLIIIAGANLILAEQPEDAWVLTAILGIVLFALPLVAAKYATKWREDALLADGYTLSFTLNANNEKEALFVVCNATVPELVQGLGRNWRYKGFGNKLKDPKSYGGTQ